MLRCTATSAAQLILWTVYNSREMEIWWGRLAWKQALLLRCFHCFMRVWVDLLVLHTLCGFVQIYVRLIMSIVSSWHALVDYIETIYNFISLPTKHIGFPGPKKRGGESCHGGTKQECQVVRASHGGYNIHSRQFPKTHLFYVVKTNLGLLIPNAVSNHMRIGLFMSLCRHQEVLSRPQWDLSGH